MSTTAQEVQGMWRNLGGGMGAECRSPWVVGIRQSVSRSGCCYDNAVAESCFHSLKVEWLHGHEIRDRETVRTEVFRYIEGFYNRSRRHSSLGYLNPDAFERRNPVAA